MKSLTHKTLLSSIQVQLREIEQQYLYNQFARTTPIPISAVIKGPDGEQLVVYIDDVINKKAQLPDNCYTTNLTKQEVFIAVAEERDYQDTKYGVDHEQSLPGFLLIIESILEKAKHSWNKDLSGRKSVLSEVTQIAATAVACLEKYGTSGNDRSLDIERTLQQLKKK